MKKLFGNTVRKLSVSSNSTSTSAFNLRRLSVHSNSSTLNALQIKVLRGGYNIDLDKVDSSFTKLHKAVYLNNEEKLVRYLNEIGSGNNKSSGKKAPKHNVNALDSCSRSVLHLAAINGNLRIIKLLLAAGANVNVQDSDGRTPMIKAIECGHTDVLQMLIETGADVDLADREKGNTALHTALIGANLDCALYIIRNALIIDYNKRNHKKETFLHLAAKIPDLFVVIEELIANGIEIEATDELGRTAAQIAQLHGNEEAFKVITKYATAKAQPAMPMSSAAEDQLSASVDLIDGPSSYENISAIQHHQNPHHFQHPYPPPVSRTGSRSSSKLSASDSFASNASSRSGGRGESGGGGHNFLRFSGLFEETILEENKKDSSNSSSTTANDSSKSSPNKAASVSKAAMERSESIYENYQPPGSPSGSSFMPPPNSVNVVRRKKEPMITTSVSAEEEMLSDELSELDVMLASDIGINSDNKQQQRRSSTTALLNASPTSASVVSTTPVSEGQSSTVNGHQVRTGRLKAQWLELLEEKEVTVLEHTGVLQAIGTTINSVSLPSTANSTTSSNAVFTFNTGPTGTTAAGAVSNSFAGQNVENLLNKELQNRSESSRQSSPSTSTVLSGPTSLTSPILATTVSSVSASTRESPVLSPSSSVKSRGSNASSKSSGLSVHAQPFQPRQLTVNSGNADKQKQPPLSLSYAQVASFSPRKGATTELQQQENQLPNKTKSATSLSSRSSPATSPPLSPPSFANQQKGGVKGENGSTFVSTVEQQSPAKLNNGLSLPENRLNTVHQQQQQLQQSQSPVRRNFESPRGSISSSGSNSSYNHHLLQHNDFDRSRPSRHSVSGGTASTNNHRASLNFAQQMMAGGNSGGSGGLPYHQKQPLTTTLSYAQLVANQNGGCGGSLGRNITSSNNIFNNGVLIKPFAVDCAVQTEELEPSGAAKYDALLQSVDRLLTSSTVSLADNNQNFIGKNSSNWNNEMSTLKRLSSLVYEANHNSIELEYKRKEVALLKATTESLQAQLEHEQTLKRQFENRLKKLLNPAGGGRRSSLMLLNGNSSELNSVGDGNFSSVIKQYESALRTAMTENVALKDEVEALREMYFQLQFEIGNGSAVADKVGDNDNEVVKHATDNNNHLTDAELGYLLTQLDTKLTSLTETLADKQKLIENGDKEGTPSFPVFNHSSSNQQGDLQESFIVEQLRDEITGLKEMMLHLLVPNSNIENGQLISSNYHHHPTLTPSTQAELSAILENGSSTKKNYNFLQHIRRHSDFEQRLTNLCENEKEDFKNSVLTSKLVEHDHLSPRKSFSLHDLVSLSDDNGKQSVNQDLSKVDVAARKSYDGHLQQLEHHHYQQQENENRLIQIGNGTTGVNNQSCKTGARSNLQADYSNSFSYKSKYFQSKINELRKQLGIAQ